jgi:hypothetical protein
MVYNNFAIFAGYQDIFDVGDMGILGLLGYPKNNGLVLGVISYTRDYECLLTSPRKYGILIE